jgi:hypothetical protein
MKLHLRIGILAGLAVGVPAMAWADPPRPAARPAAVAAAAPVPRAITLRVMVVRGTNASSHVDAELESLTRLRNMAYTGFTLIDRDSVELVDGGDATFAIEGGRQLHVTLVSHDAAQAKVHLELTGRSGNTSTDTAVSIHRNGQFLVSGPHLGDDLLILPISSRY